MLLKDLLDTYKKPMFKNEVYISTTCVYLAGDGDIHFSNLEVLDLYDLDDSKKNSEYRYYPVLHYEIIIDEFLYGEKGIGTYKPTIVVYVFDPGISTFEELEGRV